MSTEIYILRLEEGKFYVGKSINADTRIAAHAAGSASFWTKRYKMIEVIKIIKDASPFDEDRYTKELMAEYGIDNVRGGAYVTMSLTPEQKETIKREIWGAQDRCARCGHTGHFIRQCKAAPASTDAVVPETVVPATVVPATVVPAANTITITIPKPVMAMKAWFSATFSKLQNEFKNPDSDLRSGRLFNSSSKHS